VLSPPRTRQGQRRAAEGNQRLQGEVDELRRKSEGDTAMIRSLQDRAGTLPTLPHERLKRLFTTHAIQLGRLTGGADLDPAKPGHEGLRVFVTPLDETGDPLKAAGAITVEAFDLSRGEGAKVGTWNFDPAATRAAWSSVLNRYNYVVTCPWQQAVPAGPNLHLVVTFVDELTQGRFTKSADVTVQPHRRCPPAVDPARRAGSPATQPVR
jgi:hypothetical protein